MARTATARNLELVKWLQKGQTISEINGILLLLFTVYFVGVIRSFLYLLRLKYALYNLNSGTVVKHATIIMFSVFDDSQRTQRSQNVTYLFQETGKTLVVYFAKPSIRCVFRNQICEKNDCLNRFLTRGSILWF